VRHFPDVVFHVQASAINHLSSVVCLLNFETIKITVSVTMVSKCLIALLVASVFLGLSVCQEEVAALRVKKQKLKPLSPNLRQRLMRARPIIAVAAIGFTGALAASSQDRSDPQLAFWNTSPSVPQADALKGASA